MQQGFVLDQDAWKMELPKKCLVPSNQTKIKGSEAFRTDIRLQFEGQMNIHRLYMNHEPCISP
jgi:hypothetical protein